MQVQSGGRREPQGVMMSLVMLLIARVGISTLRPCRAMNRFSGVWFDDAIADIGLVTAIRGCPLF